MASQGPNMNNKNSRDPFWGCLLIRIVPYTPVKLVHKFIENPYIIANCALHYEHLTWPTTDFFGLVVHVLPIESTFWVGHNTYHFLRAYELSLNLVYRYAMNDFGKT